MRALAEKRGDYMIRIDPMLEETDTAFLDEVRRLGFTVNQASDFSLFQPRMCYVLDLQASRRSRFWPTIIKQSAMTSAARSATA